MLGCILRTGVNRDRHYLWRAGDTHVYTHTIPNHFKNSNRVVAKAALGMSTLALQNVKHMLLGQRIIQCGPEEPLSESVFSPLTAILQ